MIQLVDLQFYHHNHLSYLWYVNILVLWLRNLTSELLGRRELKDKMNWYFLYYFSFFRESDVCKRIQTNH